VGLASNGRQDHHELWQLCIHVGAMIAQIVRNIKVRTSPTPQTATKGIGSSIARGGRNDSTIVTAVRSKTNRPPLSSTTGPKPKPQLMRTPPEAVPDEIPLTPPGQEAPRYGKKCTGSVENSQLHRH